MRACHGSFQGRGGFRLSLLGFDPAADYEALVTEAQQQAANLVSHHGSWAAHPVSRYVAGEVTGYTAIVYIG